MKEATYIAFIHKIDEIARDKVESVREQQRKVF